ncbi:thiamine-monophosphate kinase [Luteolibacter pohnpeiensis]|uniref:Thiamine-monophosphate kinase n=1 Tax=Luteolibacter pohnpeiensis TaxID=454153 RepID=A0A934S3J0_9BACT|nr:thiamine-phosphate kinase [Luteolibacter pohnpeiensis]MBK1881816.1 thiamine-monophosphate kinase [Luteolibacter pohnpeiensis]
MQLRDIGEDALIERLVALVPHDPSPWAGPGDDCAVIDDGHGALRLLKTDALVENVHFTPDAEPHRVGWKAVARVISDFAAMGGKPEHFLITLALPPTLPVAWVEEFYRGIGTCLRKFGGYLAGGETSSVPIGSAAVISIAATGKVERDEWVLRSTARAGDAILVTGKLGGSLAGKHLDFTPRAEQAQWLVKHFKPTAMMDLSDGLAKDLPRLAKASGLGFMLEKSAIPITPGCSLQQALGDGEDFELLITTRPESLAELMESWARHFPELGLTQIGTMTSAGEGGELSGGWDHFKTLGN